MKLSFRRPTLGRSRRAKDPVWNPDVIRHAQPRFNAELIWAQNRFCELLSGVRSDRTPGRGRQEPAAWQNRMIDK